MISKVHDLEKIQTLDGKCLSPSSYSLLLEWGFGGLESADFPSMHATRHPGKALPLREGQKSVALENLTLDQGCLGRGEILIKGGKCETEKRKPHLKWGGSGRGGSHPGPVFLGCQKQWEESHFTAPEGGK